jgi:glycosyltransferase involved in cell wall biosynthesis
MPQTISTNHPAASVDSHIDPAQHAEILGRPLNVCMMVDNLARAGVETQILQLIERFDRTVINPHLCLLDGTGPESRAMEPADCHVERLGVKSLRRPATLPKAVRFARYLRRHHIDIVHPHFPDSLYFAAPIATLLGVPVVRFRVNLGYWMRPIDRRLMRFYNRFIDATLVNCRACRDAVIEQENAPPDSISIIPNGVDLSRYEGLAEESLRRWQSDGPRTIGAVANLRHVKGLDIFIRAAAIVATRHPDVRFVVAGEGDQRPELEALIRELGLEHRFELPGRTGDVPALLRGIDIAVLSSRSEGAPNVIMEYMAAGKPVVATDVGGVGEMVRHDEAGLLIPSESVEELARAIGSVLSRPDLAIRFAQFGRELALAEFGLETQSRRYESFYLQCFCHKLAHEAD